MLEGFHKSTLRSDQGMVWGRFVGHGGLDGVILCEENVRGSADISITPITNRNYEMFFAKYPSAVDDSEDLLSKQFPDAFKAAKSTKKEKKKSKKK